VELHLFYNSLVFIPMMIGMYFHLRPRPWERTAMTCRCGRMAQPVTAARLAI
jgi:hypothetical protein